MLVSGSTWQAPDAVRRFKTAIDPTEVQFQPGTWLVRAATITQLIHDHTPGGLPSTGTEGPPSPAGSEPTHQPQAPPSSEFTKVVFTATQIPGSKVRDVIKVAVTPLIATGAAVTVTLEVTASHPEGIPRDTLELAVKEGLRQLNIDHDLD